MLRFYLMPVALHTAFAKCPVNLGSLFDMMHFGMPKRGSKCLMYKVATPSPSMVLLHRMNLADLEHPWLTMVRMVSYFPDFGRLVIRSIETYWKGLSSACVSKGCKGALQKLFLVLAS
jgi:hypothetical protein